MNVSKVRETTAVPTTISETIFSLNKENLNNSNLFYSYFDLSTEFCLLHCIYITLWMSSPALLWQMKKNKVNRTTTSLMSLRCVLLWTCLFEVQGIPLPTNLPTEVYLIILFPIPLLKGRGWYLTKMFL